MAMSNQKKQLSSKKWLNCRSSFGIMAALLVLYRLGETVQMVHSKGYMGQMASRPRKGRRVMLWRLERGLNCLVSPVSQLVIYCNRNVHMWRLCTLISKGTIWVKNNLVKGLSIQVEHHASLTNLPKKQDISRTQEGLFVIGIFRVHDYKKRPGYFPSAVSMYPQ